MVKSLIANGVSAFCVGIIFLIRQDYGEKMILRVFLITFLITTISRLLTKKYICSKFPKLKILIVGKLDESKEIIKKFFIKYHKTYEIKCVESDVVSENDFDGIDEVLINNVTDTEIREKLIRFIMYKGVGYKITPNDFEIVIGTSESGQIYDSMIFYKDASRHLIYYFFKRSMDLLIGGLLFLLTLPFLLLSMLALKIESPKDPVFYSQKRITKGGRVFNVIKLRSMFYGAEKKSGAVLAGKNDQRITPVGGILRKFRLDEIPQFINVLKGDMSLIGPRPERPEFVSQYEQSIPLYNYRHKVRAGLTGLAQISGFYSTPAEEKLKHDLYYIQKYSILLDIKILLLTIEVCLEPSKAEGLGEELSLEEILEKYGYQIVKKDTVYYLSEV